MLGGKSHSVPAVMARTLFADALWHALLQGQSTFLITNDNELNSWNQTRGYAIVHTRATASQLLRDTHPLVM